MNQDGKTAGPGPGAIVDGVAGSAERPAVKYETGKGCLIFVLVGLALAGVVTALIVLLGDPPPIAG